MEEQVKKILELAQVVYEKGGAEKYPDVWEVLSQAYQETKDEAVRDRLLEYFHEPNRETFQERHEKNLASLKDKVHGYSLDENGHGCKLLWKDQEAIYYLKDNEIKAYSLLQCAPEESRKVCYVNVMPENLPAQSSRPYILYYDEDVFDWCVQISSFAEISEKTACVLVGKGVEGYIQQSGLIAPDVFIGYGADGIVDRIKAAESQFLYAERRMSYGSLYGSLTFYVIRIRPINSSWGGLMMWVIQQLKVAEDRGYIPVIDFSYFWNIFFEEGEIGLINPWEYYFEQPTRFSLQAAYHAQNVVLGDATVYGCGTEGMSRLLDDAGTFQEWVRIFHKYVHMSKRIEKKCMSIYESLIRPEWRILGVNYRGTGYRVCPVDEFRQPDTEKLLQKTAELLEQWNCDHIFLSTEDKGGVEMFRERFGGKVIYTERERYESTVVRFETNGFNREYDAYFKGEDYLTDIFILSKCNCLLSGRCGILAAVLPMNGGKYEERYIYDLGLYTKDDHDEWERRQGKRET